MKLNIAEDFTDFKDTEYQRYRDIEYRAYVTDATTGRSEPRNFTVRLSHYAVHIYLNKMGGNDREGDYIVNAAYADGAPAACKVSLDWMDADSRPSRTAVVTTNRYGLARVHLRYPSAAPGAGQTFNLRLTARDAEQRTSLFDDMLNADDAKTIWISVAATLMKPGQNIEATLHGQVGSTIDVDAVAVSGVINHQQVHMMHAAEPISVLMGDDFRGLVTLMAYSLNNDVDRFSYGFFRWGGFKSVLYPEDRQLKLKLAGLRTSYAPGAAVDAGIDVRAAGDFAAPSALEVSVIDTAVEQRAATEEDANQRLSSWSWWRDESNIAGVTWEDLVKRDSSQPIPDDLQLAAEAGLQYNIPFQLAIESEDYDDVRNDLNALMRKALKPVGDAILAARPVRLPATLDGVHAITIAANLDAAVLLDPWDTPYRVQSAVEWNDEVVSMVSAGPDKRFGTADDFTIDVARRNLFALPGERLIGLLKDAVAVDQPLPGTVEALKQLTLAQGLDLDAIFDPDGKSFLYGIEVGPRHYTVRVSRVGGAPVWNTPFVDYFSHSEARMQVALNEWTSMGKPFPATEAEVRAAFSAAGIDLDGLRDPLGRAFELRIVQLMSYTRVEKVTAGTRSQETSRPVTQQYLAIQVMQPGSGPDQGNVPQVVAQFLHPITRQGGSDAKPVPIAAGTFKGNTGAIGGTITDPSGAAIQGAVATVKNADGAAVAAVNSGADGTYLVPNLNPALYTVEIAARGFQQSTIEEVRVAAVALTTVDVELKVGAASETVTVTDAPPMLNTTDASLGGTVVGFARTPGGKVTISEQSFTPRLRHVFEETAFWAPSIETSPGGHAAFHFNLPDSLTTWKLHALASTTDGRIGEVEQTFKTFQPFFVDLDVPQVLTAGDEISLPVTLRNYTDHSIALPVTAKPADWVSLLTSAKVQATVSANGTTPLVFGLRANRSVEAGSLQITATNAHEGDAVEKTVRVHPDGEPRAVTAAGLLIERSTRLTLDVPADAIPVSIHAELRLYPNLGAHVLDAMKAVLERPYGCAEQTISSSYPSLLYLELVKASHTDKASNDPIAIEAQTYLQLGHDRLADYFDASGGLTYWGGNDHTPDPALTAYAIEFLTEAAPYIAVDRDQITGAIKWLLASQQADGGWKPRYGDTSSDLNLYIAEVLAQTVSSDTVGKGEPKEFHDRVAHAIVSATSRASTSATAVHAPYANALRLRLAERSPGEASTVARLRAELASTAVRDRNGAHWTPLGYSPFYGWGHAGELETTAVVLAALRQGTSSAAESALANDALLFLLRNQDRYGIWYSGQATVRVLQALLPVAIEQAKSSAATQSFQLTVNGGPVGGSEAEGLHIDPQLIEAPRSIDLTALLRPGANELLFTAAGDASLASVEATASFYVPWQGDDASVKTQTGSDAGLDFGYRCAADDAVAGKPIDCTVNARRFGSESYGMMLAEVGLPPGAEVDRSSLASLLDSWTISRYELQPDRIVFYLWSPGASGSHFSFRFIPRYAVRAKAAPATLTDYYNPDLKVVLSPQLFTIKGGARP